MASHYETATGSRQPAPPWAASLRRVSGWTTRTETCQRCRRAAAVVLRDDRPLCRGCGDPAYTHTQERHARATRLLATITAEDAATGIVGLAVPYGVPTQIRAGRWEQFEPGAFEESVVAVTRNHGGAQEGTARAFPLRSGLFFEADGLRHDARVRGVSIAFHAHDGGDSREPYQGGELRRIHRASLSSIALVLPPDVPAYRDTWCAGRSPAAWQRVYRSVQSDLADIARGER